jgi:hypothetical protein
LEIAILNLAPHSFVAFCIRWREKAIEPFTNLTHAVGGQLGSFQRMKESNESGTTILYLK